MFKELTEKNVKWFRLHCWFIKNDIPVTEMELTHTDLDHLIEEAYRFAENNDVYMSSVLVGSSVQTRVEGKFNSVMYYTLTPIPSSAPESPYRTSLPKARCQGGNAIVGM
jgi:hypothetical protein|nr:MAG TPA: hypothetical protein [Caudoviricetes sp.]